MGVDAIDFAAGCVGGMMGVFVGHPFDTVKVRLQTQPVSGGLYSGTFHCFKTIIKTESIFGLFKGMSSPLYTTSVLNAIVFGVAGNVQRRMTDPEGLWAHFAAGFVAGTVQSFPNSPIELVKTRMQVQCPGQSNLLCMKVYKGPMDCFRKIYQTEGFKGWCKGLGCTIIRDAPAFGVYFVAFEAICRAMEPNKDVNYRSTAVLLFAGGWAGIVSWISSYPIDVVKSRLQADIGRQYSGIWDCAVKSYGAEGWKVFFLGLNSTLLRAFPVNATIFATVSWIVRLANSKEQIEPVAFQKDALPQI